MKIDVVELYWSIYCFFDRAHPLVRLAFIWAHLLVAVVFLPALAYLFAWSTGVLVDVGIPGPLAAFVAVFAVIGALTGLASGVERLYGAMRE